MTHKDSKMAFRSNVIWPLISYWTCEGQISSVQKAKQYFEFPENTDTNYNFMTFDLKGQQMSCISIVKGQNKVIIASYYWYKNFLTSFKMDGTVSQRCT